MNKKTAIKVIVLFLIAGKVYAATDKIQISQIKVVIDNSEFSWKEEGLISLNKNDESKSKKLRLLPETVLSFTNLKPGKIVTEKTLEREVKETELRIIASGFVYSAKAVVLPARKNPDKRSILITVQSGFFKRFGGGGYYGVYGLTALGGKRMEVLGYAGWNVNGVSWKYENAFGSPLIMGTSVMWDGPAAFFEEGNYSKVEGLGTIGFFLNPDLRFCVDLNPEYSFGKKFDSEKIGLKPYVKMEKYFSENLFLEFCSQTVLIPFKNEKKFDSWDSVCSVNWIPFSKITLASSMAYGKGNCSLSIYEKGLSSNSCFAERIIRSGYAEEELICSEYIYGSFEARWNAIVLNVSPVVKIKLQPFGFTDLAFADGIFKNAFGVGSRILLDNPVFAYFTLCYGWNSSGKGKFVFTAIKGF